MLGCRAVNPNPVSLTAYPAPHPGAGIERVGDQLMAASPDDHLHRFVEDDETPSHTAERIVQLADGSRTVSQIARAISEEFEGASLEQVLEDVCEFLRVLVERHVLVLHTHPLS
jgi:hypothetical protein